MRMYLIRERRVAGEKSIAVAASSIVSPPKTRSSTTMACRGSNSASRLADPRNFRVRYLLITDLTHPGAVRTAAGRSRLHEYTGSQKCSSGIGQRIHGGSLRIERKFTAEALMLLYTGRAVYADPT